MENNSNIITSSNIWRGEGYDWKYNDTDARTSAYQKYYNDFINDTLYRKYLTPENDHNKESSNEVVDSENISIILADRINNNI